MTTRAASARPLGLAVAGAQLMLALSWTVYVVFLPALAVQAGLPAAVVPWLLMADQAVFLVADYASGVASDRVLALQARLGPWLVGATALSTAAFLALPWLAPVGSPVLFVAVTLLWTASSAALRAPAMNLIGRHAARPSQPALVALAMLGLGAAAAAAPWLALVLKGQDPRLPFVLASAGVLLAALALMAAERAAPPRTAPAPAAPRGPLPGAVWLLLAALLAALAFQLHANVNAAPQWRRFVPVEALPWWLPVFWAGFNLALWPAMKLAPRLGELRFVGAAAALAAAAAALSATAPSLAVLVVAQAVCGAAWAGVLAGGFMAALALGHVGREGRFSGVVSSTLAGATLLRIALVTSGGAAALRAGGAPWADALPVLLWAGAAALLLVPSPPAARPSGSARSG